MAGTTPVPTAIWLLEPSVPTEVMSKRRSSVWPEHEGCPLAWALSEVMSILPAKGRAQREEGQSKLDGKASAGEQEERQRGGERGGEKGEGAAPVPHT